MQCIICISYSAIYRPQNNFNGKVPFEILPEKRHITWVLGVLLLTEEFQMEPLAPIAISYDTRPTVKFFLSIWSSTPYGLVY